MSYRFGHLALFVPDLREAEAFYRQVFEMEVLFREVEAEDGLWYTLPQGKGWKEADEAGVEIRMVALQRDDFTLPVFPGQPSPHTILEIGVSVAPDDIEAISSRLPDSATRLPHEYGALFFSDPFGFTWHVKPNTAEFLSNGEIAGHWLEI